MRPLTALALTFAAGLAIATPAAADPLPAERAAPVANRALDRAYAAFAKRRGVVAPAHRGAWVTADSATVTRDDHSGVRVRWSQHPPAGYELEAEIAIGPKGAMTVVKAEATFAPE
jgi:hypothetical protein